MPTVYVKVSVGKITIGCFRALCDSGAQVNLIQHSAIDGFQSSAHLCRATLYGIGDESINIKREITVTIQPWFSDGEKTPELKVSLLILPKAGKWSAIFPQQDLPTNEMKLILMEPLADPHFWKKGNVPILLGIEAWSSMASGNVFKINEHLTCQETLWGNVLFGKINAITDQPIQQAVVHKTIHALYLDELNKTIQRFWEFEDLPLCGTRSAENDLADEIFNKYHHRDESGRHVVAIPIKPTVHMIGSSREVALRRFLIQEKRFERDPNFKEKYVEYMREMFDLGHMVEAKNPPKNNKIVYYILDLFLFKF